MFEFSSHLCSVVGVVRCVEVVGVVWGVGCVGVVGCGGGVWGAVTA